MSNSALLQWGCQMFNKVSTAKNVPGMLWATWIIEQLSSINIFEPNSEADPNFSPKSGDSQAPFVLTPSFSAGTQTSNRCTLPTPQLPFGGHRRPRTLTPSQVFVVTSTQILPNTRFRPPPEPPPQRHLAPVSVGTRSPMNNPSLITSYFT